jgi:hypothetical protein
VTILRWTLLAAIMVAMGLATVWWKTQTLASGYQAAKDQRRLSQLIEEERVEAARLARITAPARVVVRAREMGLMPRVRSVGSALALLSGAADGGHALALVGPDGRPKGPH